MNIKDELYVNGALLKQIFKTCSDVIIYKDTNFDFVMTNEAFLDTYHLKEEDVIGKNDEGVLGMLFTGMPLELAVRRIREEDEKVLRTKKPSEFNYDFLQSDGSIKSFNIKNSPILDDKGNVKGILVISRDITEANTNKNKLEAKRCQLATVLDNIPSITCLKTPGGKILDCSRTFAQMVGLDYEAFKTLNPADVCSPEYARVMQEDDKTVCRTRKPLSAQRQVCFKNNVCFWVQMSRIPIFDKDGEVSEILVVFNNIDEEKRREIQKDNYIANLTHDFKTPVLAQIRALQRLLKSELSANQQEAVSMILESCEYVYKMTCEMMEVYKLQGGNKTPNYEIFNVVELVENVCCGVSTLAEEGEQEILIQNKTENSELNADKTEIQRVVTNFVSNAISYSNKNSKIIVKIEENKNDGDIALSVQSEGSTIEQKELDSIFEKYVSYSNRYQKTGNGLGLYLSKQILKLHNGSVFAKSNDGVNVFGFKIPNGRQTKGKTDCQTR